MGKYIKEFSNHTEYEGLTLVTPNVINCNRENHVHYSPYIKHGEDYSNDYLTFEIVKDGTLIWTKTSSYDGTSCNIQYSIDNGTTWNTVTSAFESSPFLNVVAGQKILFKGNNNTYTINHITTDTGGHTYDHYVHSHFGGTAEFNVYGNIKSILNNNSTISLDRCLEYLFAGSQVVNAKHLILPYTNLTKYCYASMFSNCKLLRKVPILPATTLANYCYSLMFLYCTSLTTAPQLPATTLASYCYDSMFYNCTSLTIAPTLPSTTLVNSCYTGMFAGCTSLTTAPELPAMTLAANCYSNMFLGCSSLNYIKALFTTEPSRDYTYNWVSDVASTGTFIKDVYADWTTSGTNGVPTNWTIETNLNIEEAYLAFYANVSGTFQFSQNGLSYSLDRGNTWTSLSKDTATPTIEAGNVILWKASGLDPATSGIGIFSSTGSFNVRGNIMSLVNGDNFKNTSNIGDYLFKNLFFGSKVYSASKLTLPAIVTPYCYDMMFYNSKLQYCPILPATTLASHCYMHMFARSLISSAPLLPALTLVDGCYFEMFLYCSSLSSVKAMFIEIGSSSNITYWLSGVKTYGYFTKNSLATWTDAGIPSSWTIVTADS